MKRRLFYSAAAFAVAACSTPSLAPVEHRRAETARPQAGPQQPPKIDSDLPQAVPSRSGEISSQPLTPTNAQSLPPARPAPVKASERPRQITVKKGDTLFSLSETYSVPLHTVISANELAPPYALRIGQTLKLPPPEIHVVKAGETLNQIAARYNIDPPSLLLLNRIHNPQNLAPGQTILLPADEPMRRIVSASGANGSSSSTTSSTATSSGTSRPAASNTPAEPKRGVKIVDVRFDWPVKGRVISTFGVKSQGLQNDGVNIAATAGDPVHAAGGGVVVYAGNELAGYGELLLIEHDGGWITAYAHNRVLKVKEGDRVSRGQTIAEAGETGSVDTPQVHFEVRNGVSPVDPMQYLPPR